MTPLARSKYSPERRVRSSRIACWRSVSAATRAGSMCVTAGSVAVMPHIMSPRAARVRELTAPLAQQRAAHLAARGLGQLVGVVDPARVLVRRGLVLHVVLQLAGQRIGRSVPLAQHDHRAHDA